MPSPTTPAEFAKARNSIGDQVSKMLGNTHPQDGARLVHRPDRVHGVGGRRQCLIRSSCSPQRNATVSCRRTSRRTATPPLTARHWTRRPPLRGRPRRQGQRAMAYRSPQHKHGGGKFKSVSVATYGPSSHGQRSAGITTGARPRACGRSAVPLDRPSRGRRRAGDAATSADRAARPPDGPL
jgi:hypothetical protein